MLLVQPLEVDRGWVRQIPAHLRQVPRLDVGGCEHGVVRVLLGNAHHRGRLGLHVPVLLAGRAEPVPDHAAHAALTAGPPAGLGQAQLPAAPLPRPRRQRAAAQVLLHGRAPPPEDARVRALLSRRRLQGVPGGAPVRVDLGLGHVGAPAVPLLLRRLLQGGQRRVPAHLDEAPLLGLRRRDAVQEQPAQHGDGQLPQPALHGLGAGGVREGRSAPHHLCAGRGPKAHVGAKEELHQGRADALARHSGHHVPRAEALEELLPAPVPLVQVHVAAGVRGEDALRVREAAVVDHHVHVLDRLLVQHLALLHDEARRGEHHVRGEGDLGHPDRHLLTDNGCFHDGLGRSRALLLLHHLRRGDNSHLGARPWSALRGVPGGEEGRDLGAEDVGEGSLEALHRANGPVLVLRPAEDWSRHPHIAHRHPVVGQEVPQELGGGDLGAHGEAVEVPRSALRRRVASEEAPVLARHLHDLLLLVFAPDHLQLVDLYEHDIARQRHDHIHCLQLRNANAARSGPW
mmetsp:Transcript_106402/g.301280  ORF Transcript_106402/g.301280 Transcript_106402/m.301280 type:complete len:515 (-) Transcript_106402:508-2052(-)